MAECGYRADAVMRLVPPPTYRWSISARRAFVVVGPPDGRGAQDIAVARSLARRVDNVVMETCTYCGDDAGTRDHVIPVSFTHGYRVFTGTTTVLACNECNTLAGDNVFVSLAEKAAYLVGAVKRRHKRLLLMPDWSELELSAMSQTFRKRIMSKMATRRDVYARLAVLRDVARNGDDSSMHRHIRVRNELLASRSRYPKPMGKGVASNPGELTPPICNKTTLKNQAFGAIWQASEGKAIPKPQKRSHGSSRPLPDHFLTGFDIPVFRDRSTWPKNMVLWEPRRGCRTPEGTGL